jgi:hypothetical protein
LEATNLLMFGGTMMSFGFELLAERNQNSQVDSSRRRRFPPMLCLLFLPTKAWQLRLNRLHSVTIEVSHRIDYQ